MGIGGFGAEHPARRRPAAGKEVGGVGKHHAAIVVFYQLESKAPLVLGVMAVGDAHRNAGAARLPHDQTAEFVHMAVDDAVLRMGGENLIERMGIGERTLLCDEGDPMDDAAAGEDLGLVYAGKGAEKIELDQRGVRMTVQVHEKAFVAAMIQPGHAL